MSGLPEIVCGGVSLSFAADARSRRLPGRCAVGRMRAARLGWLACGLTRDPPLALLVRRCRCLRGADSGQTLPAFCEWLAGRLSSDFAHLPARRFGRSGKVGAGPAADTLPNDSGTPANDAARASRSTWPRF